MNIGIVTTWEERGASYVSKQYYDALSTRFNVKVFARGGRNKSSGSVLFDENKCYRSRASTRIYSTYINKHEFLSWIKRNSIEVVFFNEQNWWPPVAWCKEKGIYAGTYVDYYKENTIPFFDLFDFLICNTQRHYSAFSWHPHACYIPWGTDVEVYRPQSKEGSKQTVFFHSCGQAPSRKGTDLVINAYTGIASNNIKLIIHSQRDLGDFISTTLGVKKKDLKKNIELIEESVSAPGLYHLGHVYVYPSRLDGLGLTIAEALSCGLPVIVPNYAPMNEFVSDERGKLVGIERNYARSDGYYWPMNVVNVEDLRQKMLYYVENPSAIGSESEKARAYAVAELDWRKRYSAVNDIFERCLESPVRKNNSISKEIIESEKSIVSRTKRLLMEVDSFTKKLSLGL